MSIETDQAGIRIHDGQLTMSYASGGDSSAPTAILLVHGLGGRWQHWARVMPAIGERHRVVAVDLPGFGTTPVPASGPLDLPGMADALAAMTRELSLTRVTFVGHSFGGPLGTIFATRHRDLAERLVLVSGTVQTFQRTLGGKVAPWLRHPRTAATTLAELLYLAMPLPALLRRAAGGSALLRRLALWPFVWRPGSLRPEDARLMLDGAGAPGAVPTARAIGRASGWERLPVQVPVTLINTDHDRIAPFGDLRAYPGRVDRVLVIKNSGHMPMIEAPEGFVAALEYAMAT